jgi:hypothetical protein
MRIMVLVKATADSEAGKLPEEKLFADMGKFNAELVKAGLLLDASGLKPTSAAARLRFDGKTRTVIDGPFTESKELVSGYWILQVKSKEEAIEWMKRAPFDGGVEIELRPFYELDDFAPGPAIDKARALEKELMGQKASS